MTKRHSTGALSDAQRAAQDARYADGPDYDYVIVGSGSAALTVGALLAHAGHRVCLLEAHDVAGGYLHTFAMGDYHFCAQVHYVWGAGPGEPINAFLQKIGLADAITFEALDPDGYDRMVMPDGKAVFVPCGYDRLATALAEAYPDQPTDGLRGFLALLTQLMEEMGRLPRREIRWYDYLLTLPRVTTLWRYKAHTLQMAFDEFGLTREQQAVLCAQAGDFMLPPERLSLFAYIGLFGGYNTGAYYPTEHFRGYVDRLVAFIDGHAGCDVFFETEVTGFELGAAGVEAVTTADGKRFTAERGFICNMDPQRASHLIGRDRFPQDALQSLSYEYSASGLMVYLGLKDIDLTEHGFGNFNTWHLSRWDMNAMWRDQAAGDFSEPWVFLSTPTLHADPRGVAPEGGHILEIGTFADYGYFKQLQDESYQAYSKRKHAVARRLIDFAVEHHLPDLRDHIAVQVVGSPTTNEDFVLAPLGNAYGSEVTPENVGTDRLKADTPWPNLWWCNASSGFGGVYGTVLTGLELYQQLTGDRDFVARPTVDESVAEVHQHKIE